MDCENVQSSKKIFCVLLVISGSCPLLQNRGASGCCGNHWAGAPFVRSASRGGLAELAQCVRRERQRPRWRRRVAASAAGLAAIVLLASHRGARRTALPARARSHRPLPPHASAS